MRGGNTLSVPSRTSSGPREGWPGHSRVDLAVMHMNTNGLDKISGGIRAAGKKQTIENKSVEVEPKSSEKKMLNIAVDPDMLLKTNDKNSVPFFDPDELLKTKGLSEKIDQGCNVIDLQGGYGLFAGCRAHKGTLARDLNLPGKMSKL